MRNHGTHDIYRPKRRPWRVLVTVLISLLVVLIILAVTLFYALQKYVVIRGDEVSLEIPFLTGDTQTPTADTPADALPDVELIIDEPDYSDIQSSAGLNLSPVRAVYVPAKDVNADGIAAARALLTQFGAEGLVLEMKPASGRLSWTSAVQLATSYDTNGSFDMAETIAALKEEDIYLAAELCVCTDELMATRNPPIALKSADGAVFSDDTGYWLDPANSTVRSYIRDLIKELAAMGFDEIILKDLAHPTAEGIVYTQETTTGNDPVSMISSLALHLSGMLQESETHVSVLVSGATLHEGLWEQTGQALETLSDIFDRLWCATDIYTLSTDRETVSAVLEETELDNRFVPFLTYAEESGSWCIKLS